ncbi:hypothetical protein [Hoeflea prorocentri]|uniref:Dyp-type peroxidase family n=1 Tax=Hoeflea prorocentri TaxID=1922333 RepID=A0A9X3ZJM5_9HYPH|nr:hypothetical protein [Hoeflea prorocentri]MCY6383248.1 hypothetical protein [Hoeflea prorocentri]MDA5401048.1 hypothetical protein [Hoeflea prorocentri]
MPDIYTRPAGSQSGDAATRIQAHLGQASKFANGKTRNWSLFLFFRILSKAEMDNSRLLMARLADAVSNAEGGVPDSALDLAADLGAPQVGRCEPPTGDPAHPDPADPFPPADPLTDNFASDAFRAWLALLSKGDVGPLIANLSAFFDLDSGKPPSEAVLKLAGSLAAELKKKRGVYAALDWLQKKFDGGLSNETVLISLIMAIAVLMRHPDAKVKAAIDSIFDLTAFGDVVGEAGQKVVSQGLVAVCAYELLRQAKLARDGAEQKGHPSPVRSERVQVNGHHADKAVVYDPVPVNIAFTYPGLEKLDLDPTTLRSFPDAYRQGMAARAGRLGDTGPSAPENWHGELGLPSVSGYFTGGFQVGAMAQGDKWDMGPEEDWERLRRQVDDFNHRSGPRGKLLRTILGGLFRLVGMEIVHIELGQDPYFVENGRAVASGFRKEHFGFRDGVSQPFVDMKLGKPMPGGATPGRNGTWAPVAPGEIYLGYPDEDGNRAQQPTNALLRDGGTFMIFRKLEQDVTGFRAFLAEQRPGDPAAQQKLAAQFMGRWQNGTPLMMAPDSPRDIGPDSDRLINDFLFVRDDPRGEKCPLGSHIRRSNPRDIGGRNDVRRHRILRRGIGYGGPLLDNGSRGDGKKRGLLFIAANARIDLQFEVIQADWMNGGEFMGQAGLGKCPIAGTNSGGLQDSFHEAGATAPVTNIPAFVTTRGGDYFFAPGQDALIAMAEGERFETDAADLVSGGHSMSDPQTPGLFTRPRIEAFTRLFLNPRGAAELIRVTPPDIPPASPYPDGSTLHEPETLGRDVCFVGKHRHVSDVLRLIDADGNRRFSVAHYSEAGRRVLRGDDMVIGTETGGPTEAQRERLYCILGEAWMALDEASSESGGVRGRLAGIVSSRLEAALERTGDSRGIDLVRDLATDASYAVVDELFGTPGPGWVSELGIALPFARQHVGHLHPDWLSVSKGRMPRNPGLATMQIWSILTLGDVFGNVIAYRTLRDLSAQAGAELMNHLNRLITDAWTKRPQEARTLVDAFIRIEDRMLETFEGYTREQYHGDVGAILFELIASAMAAIPSTFGNVMDTVLRFRIGLPELFDRMSRLGVAPLDNVGGGPSLVTRLIYEAERLRPNFKILMRQCAQDTELEPGLALSEGDWVAALITAANFDATVFDDPFRFSLHPFVPEHPERPLANYLLFGAATMPREGESDLQARVRGRHCWGRDAVALHILEQCVLAAGRLDGLRNVAGHAGEMQEIAGAKTGLLARFARLRPRQF